MASPRLIKTHYPLELLPPTLLDTCKVIFVSRNVKDAAVSYFHFEKLIKGPSFHTDFTTYARLVFSYSYSLFLICFLRDIYKRGLYLYGGYFDMLESGWRRRNHKNMKFVWYEQLKAGQKEIISQICEFLHYNLSEEQIDR